MRNGFISTIVQTIIIMLGIMTSVYGSGDKNLKSDGLNQNTIKEENIVDSKTEVNVTQKSQERESVTPEKHDAEESTSVIYNEEAVSETTTEQFIENKDVNIETTQMEEIQYEHINLSDIVKVEITYKHRMTTDKKEVNSILKNISKLNLTSISEDEANSGEFVYGFTAFVFTDTKGCESEMVIKKGNILRFEDNWYRIENEKKEINKFIEFMYDTITEEAPIEIKLKDIQEIKTENGKISESKNISKIVSEVKKIRLRYITDKEFDNIEERTVYTITFIDSEKQKTEIEFCNDCIIVGGVYYMYDVSEKEINEIIKNIESYMN